MAGINVSQQWLDALDAYAEGLAATTQEASVAASQYLHERVVEKARANPDWVSLADNIETWSQDGLLIIGVRHDEMRSRAFDLEYGDEVRPPIPLFRTLAEEARRAGGVMQSVMKGGGR